MYENDENLNEWFTKDRSETSSNRNVSRMISNNILIENLALGLNVYKNTFSKEDSKKYIEILESNLSSKNKYKWSDEFS